MAFAAELAPSRYRRASWPSGEASCFSKNSAEAASEGEQAGALILHRDIAWAGLRQRNAGFLGQALDRLGERRALRLDDEREDVAVLAGGEAMVEALLVVDVKEGVFSGLNGERPLNSRPARLSGTLRATTWLTGSRARISSSRDGGKRMGLRVAVGGCAVGHYVIRALRDIRVGHSATGAVARCRTDSHRKTSARVSFASYFSSSFTSPLALPKSIWPA